MSTEAARRYCGREFSAAELDHIRALLELRPALGRVVLSRRICQDLGWLNVLGQPKAMSCRVALFRSARAGASLGSGPGALGLSESGNGLALLLME